jgi:hypothetical protein
MAMKNMANIIEAHGINIQSLLNNECTVSTITLKELYKKALVLTNKDLSLYRCRGVGIYFNLKILNKL